MKLKYTAIHWDVIAMFALLLLCDTAAQLFFKTAVIHLGEFPTDSIHTAFDYIVNLARNSMVWAGAGTMVVAFLTWLAIIARVDLSKAHPATSLSFGTVTLCSTWILHEPFTTKQAIGVVLIMLGAYICSEHADARASINPSY